MSDELEEKMARARELMVERNAEERARRAKGLPSRRSPFSSVMTPAELREYQRAVGDPLAPLVPTAPSESHMLHEVTCEDWHGERVTLTAVVTNRDGPTVFHDISRWLDGIKLKVDGGGDDGGRREVPAMDADTHQ